MDATISIFNQQLIRIPLSALYDIARLIQPGVRHLPDSLTDEPSPPVRWDYRMTRRRKDLLCADVC